MTTAFGVESGQISFQMQGMDLQTERKDEWASLPLITLDEGEGAELAWLTAEGPAKGERLADAAGFQRALRGESPWPIAFLLLAPRKLSEEASGALAKGEAVALGDAEGAPVGILREGGLWTLEASHLGDEGEMTNTLGSFLGRQFLSGEVEVWNAPGSGLFCQLEHSVETVREHLARLDARERRMAYISHDVMAEVMCVPATGSLPPAGDKVLPVGVYLCPEYPGREYQPEETARFRRMSLRLEASAGRELGWKLPWPRMAAGTRGVALAAGLAEVVGAKGLTYAKDKAGAEEEEWMKWGDGLELNPMRLYGQDDAAQTKDKGGPEGAVVFFTGLSGSGKSTLAKRVRAMIAERDGRSMTVLDGDLVRRHLSSELTFSKEHRDLNIRRIGFVAAEVARHGGLAICAPIAPYESTREAVRQMVMEAGGIWLLIHVATPVEECERRDRKGLYAKARAGIIPSFTGISDPYEEPPEPALRVDTSGRSIEEVAEEVYALLASRGIVGQL